MQNSVADKALIPLGGLTAVGRCVQAFLAADPDASILIVYRDDPQKSALKTAVESIHPRPSKIIWVQGGSERQASVWNALQAAPSDSQYVYIHDVARPCVHPDAIAALQSAVQRDGAAVLAHPVTDTIKRIPAGGGLRSAELEDLDRNRLWAMETPQAFETAKIRAAYQHIRDLGLQVTDDTAAAASIGLKTTIVPNPYPNPKLTTPADLPYIEQLLKVS